jgi:FKBP-type peptidyl-prolyl cis-trans isomerase FklB
MKNLTREKIRFSLTVCLLIASAPLALAQNPPAAGTPPPSTAPGADPAPPPTPEQISYIFGETFGWQLHNSGVTNELSSEALNRGLKAGLQGKKPTLAEQQQMTVFLRGVQQASIERNEAASKTFLERNAQARGVVTTASGLQYKVLSAGDKSAPAINPTDRVTVDYRGKLMDGTEFDSSYSRGMPATFPVGGVIKGWQEALVMMKPGAKWQLFIPPALAYGDQAKEKIPAGSALIFDVSLLKAESTAAPAAPPGTARPTATPTPPPK